MNYEELPVYRQKEKILDCLKANRVIIVQSPTGSGKTTQIPIILHDAGYGENGIIGVTQPRRIATISVSDFIARQLGCRVGDFIGYKMRFDDKTSAYTRLKIMTDGILLQELKQDRYLSKYSVIMVDEAHERSLNIDFILGLLKEILKARSDFKVIISSATINAEIFSRYFDNAPVVTIDTPIYPVNIHYRPTADKHNEELLYSDIADIVEQRVKKEEKGDILVFLSGEAAIKGCLKELISRPMVEKLVLYPLYGRLSKEEQERVFTPTPPGMIKVVVSTNIAETSVTIDGISAVIDSGTAKINFYNNKTYTSSLIESEISKASADQRKGRAGRTGPGDCYRLYTKLSYEHKPKFSTEEIFRTDLSEVILRMADLGIRDFEHFDFLSPPNPASIAGGMETLQLLEAITAERELTEIGKMMVEFPLLPRHARMIIESIYRYPDVLGDVVTATAFLSTHTPFALPPGEELAARAAHHRFRDPAGDFISYLKIYSQFTQATDKELFCKKNYLDCKMMSEIVNIKEQLEAILAEKQIPVGTHFDLKSFLLSLSKGLIQFVCVRTKTNVYRSVTAEKISIHPGSVLYKENAEFIVAGEVVKTSKTFAHSVSKLQKEWIREISQDLYNGLMKNRQEKKERLREVEEDAKDGVTLCRQTFPVGRDGSQKGVVQLDWDRYRKIRYDISDKDIKKSASLRASILWRGYRILSAEKMRRLMFTAQFLNPEQDFIESVDRQPQPFGDRLLKNLSFLLKLTPFDKKSKNLGFVFLRLTEKGEFALDVSQKFTVAVNESLGALEELVDMSAEKASARQVEQLNRVYRRLSIIEDKF